MGVRFQGLQRAKMIRTNVWIGHSSKSGKDIVLYLAIVTDVNGGDLGSVGESIVVVGWIVELDEITNVEVLLVVAVQRGVDGCIIVTVGWT
jgi:hypothetical protein